MKTPLIKLENVSKYYKTKTGVSEGMRGVSIEFFNNEFVAVTGESGSGKTTLLNVISGLDSYEDGELFYNGKETSHFTVKDFEKFRAKNIGFVFQNYNVIDSYTVYDNVVIALLAQNYPKDKIKERAIELIKKVGLLCHMNQRTSKLSGGQKQRVVIARALAKDAPIILADEPTGNLDKTSSYDILNLLKDISKDKLVIMVSHNIEEVDNFATRKVIMKDGNITNDIVVEKKEITEANLNEDLSNKNSILKGLQIAFKNILRTPKRTLFTLLLSSIVLFSFIYFYSSLIVNTIESINALMSDDYSIAVIKRDETSYTKAEIDSFESSKYIHKYLNIDFKTIDKTPIDFEGNEYEKTQYIFEPKILSSLKARYIVEGNAPSNKYEVLLPAHPYYGEPVNIGDKIDLNGIEFEVSGLFRNPYNEIYRTNRVYLHDSFVYDDNLVIEEEAKPFLLGDNKLDSLTIEASDRKEIKLYKKKIDDIKYQIIDIDLILEKQMEFIIGTLKLILWVVLIIIIQVIFLVIYQIQKNVMEARKKDFSVYRSIGISEQEVSFMILFEQLIISLIAAIIIITLLEVTSLYLTAIYKITRNITLLNYFLIIIIFVLFSLRLGRQFNKKIFGLTVIEALKEDD